MVDLGRGARSSVSFEEFRRVGPLDEEFLYFRILSKTVALWFAWALFRLRVTPNQVTTAAIALAAPAAWANIHGDTWVGLAIFHFFFILDTADGIIARGSSNTSVLGAYLDDVGHYVFHSAWLASFAVGAMEAGETTLAAAAAGFLLVDTLARAHLDLASKVSVRIHGVLPPRPGPDAASIKNALRSTILGTFSFPNALVWLTALAIVSRGQQAYLIYAAVSSALYLAYTMWKTAALAAAARP